MTHSLVTQNDDSIHPVQSTCGFNLLDAACPDSLAHSRMIGHLLGFKNREGRFVILESLLDFLTNTKRLPGLDGFRIDQALCRLELTNHKYGCENRWVFGTNEQWESDQCCGILALHKTNWTSGKRLPEADAFQWAVNERINRLLVLCLPPEDFVATHEQIWEAMCEEEP